MSSVTRSHPYLVCELANSHAGNADIVRNLISEFAKLEYPAKGIKFQVFRADSIALPDFSWYSVYEELAFDEEEWRALINEAGQHGDVWIDVFDHYSIQIIEQNLGQITGLKLQASVLENREVVDALEKLDLRTKLLAINVSGYELEKIAAFVNIFGELSANLILQIGFQSYPTEIEDTALQKIAALRQAFPRYSIGLADHADGTSDFAQLAPVYAGLLGCEFLEKHLCVSREDAKYDGYSALEPDEMQRLCVRLDEVVRASSGPFVNAAEERYLDGTVQVPILRHRVEAGTRIDLGELLFRRTAQDGISWSAANELQAGGNRVSQAIKAGRTLSESDFAPARVAAIVACRLKSSRLPKKAILPIAGVPSVERCLHQCLGVKDIGKVILATSTTKEDSELADYVCDGRAEFWKGDPDDVISRYVGACDHFGVDVIVRVTADCPLVSTEIIEYLLVEHFKSGADYTAAERTAVGTGCEIIEASALRTVIDRLGRAEHSEYMTWYFRNNPELFHLNIVSLPDEMVRNYRLTLDHPEDLQVFEQILTELGTEPQVYALVDVFALLDSRPDIAALNSHIELKYVVDQDLIAMLNEKTKIPSIDSPDTEK